MDKELIIDGIKIFYQETGDPHGSPALIMHGWGCNHSTVRFIATCLEDHMRVINVDLPGHGQSSEPDSVWGTDDFANLMEKFIEALNINEPSLIGHSFGGRTAIKMASEVMVKKLVLVDAAGIKPKRPLKYYLKIYSFKALKRILPVIMGKQRGEKKIESLRNKGGSADYKAASRIMKAVMSRCVNEDLKDIMPLIKCPSLLIWGDNDTATPLSDARTMEKLIPDSGIVSFAGCGHYSFLDNPAGFKAVVREFFKPELSSK